MSWEIICKQVSETSGSIVGADPDRRILPHILIHRKRPGAMHIRLLRKPEAANGSKRYSEYKVALEKGRLETQEQS